MQYHTTTRSRLLVSFAILSCLAEGAAAHHGNFTFDVDTVVTIEGVVIEHQWTNPHSFIRVETTAADGRVRRLTIEADGASILRPLGVTEASIQPGDRIVATASPSRRQGADAVLGREIIKPDGSLIRLSVRYAREMDSTPDAPAESVLGSWVPDRGALFDFVQWRAGWPLTAQGQASLAAYDINAPFAHSECVAAPPPTMLVYPTVKTLEVEGNSIVLDPDWMGARREIHLQDSASAAKQAIQDAMDNDQAPSLYGHSFGFWDGAALVVETVGFSPNPIGNAFGVASGVGKRLVERFELADGGYALDYSFILEDPQYLQLPVENRFRWHYRPELKSSGVACDLDAASHYLAD